MEPRRRITLLVVLVLLVLAALFLLRRCSRERPEAPGNGPAMDGAANAPVAAPADPVAAAPASPQPDEVLTPATLEAPAQVAAGAVFQVSWTGPDNRGDYVTIVRKDAADDVYGSYCETKYGGTLELTAPVDAGEYEVRYATGGARAVLGRVPVEVVAAAATLSAAPEVVAGSKLSVSWTGPDNQGDYVTLVARETPEGQYGNYTPTERGNPLTVTAPTVAGDAELRYMTGQGAKVLARRPVKILEAKVTLEAPATAVAGSLVEVTWTGPGNDQEFITVVAAGTPDGQYGNYADTRQGSPLRLLMPIMAGDAELRYMTNQGYRVYARRPIRIVAAAITLSAPDEAAVGSEVAVAWTGPNNNGDYITLVAKGTPDGQYASYSNTTSGSPARVKALEAPGEGEVRYVAGQGAKVLARRPIRIVP